jgi:hypothetical protein
MNLDSEEPADFGRLRAHRLSRARAAFEPSELGVLLLFDINIVNHPSYQLSMYCANSVRSASERRSRAIAAWCQYG